MHIEPPLRRPVENWEADRADWVAAVEQVVDDAEAWSLERHWLVHRDRKTLDEQQLGSYDVPMLLIHTPNGRLILDPFDRNIVGALGRIDLCVFPSYESVLIVRTDAGWQFATNPPTLDRPWSKEAFLEIASELAKKG